MRRLALLILVAWLMPFCTNAQINITETFNSDDRIRLVWEEYADENGSALVMDGQLYLTCKDKNSARMVFVNLPINVELDFIITSTLIVSNINDDDFFGISIDNDDFVKLGFFLSENSLYAGYYENSVEIFGEKNESNSVCRKLVGERKAIKLKSGKDQIVKTVLEKRGKKIIFTVNNMKVYEKTYKTSDFIVAPCLGYITKGNTVLKIDEVKIEQEAISNY